MNTLTRIDALRIARHLRTLFPNTKWPDVTQMADALQESAPQPTPKYTLMEAARLLNGPRPISGERTVVNPFGQCTVKLPDGRKMSTSGFIPEPWDGIETPDDYVKRVHEEERSACAWITAQSTEQKGE